MSIKDRIENTSGDQGENPPGRSEAEIRYSAVFEQSPDGILIIDSEGRILDFNKAAHTDLGYTREEFSKLRVSDIDPVESPEEIRAHILKTINEKKAEFEVTHRTKSGQIKNVLVITQTIVLSDRTVLHAIWRDITEQKAADKTLLESEAKYRDLFENASDAVFVLDSELRYVDVNKRGLDLLGYTRDELLGRRPFDFIPDEQRPRSAAEFDKLRGRGSYDAFEGRMLTKDGRWIDVEVSSTAIFRDGVFTGSRDIVRDITNRKDIEKALKESERDLRLLFESATDGIFILDMQGHFIDVNRSAYERLGYTKQEMLSMKINELDPPEFASMIPGRLAQIKESGSAVFESAHLRKDGSRMPVEVNSRIIEYKGMNVYFSVVRDITERRKDEEALRTREKQLAESQRIARIGSWEHNLKTGRVFWSDELYRILGLDPGTDQGDFQLFFDMLHPDDRPVLKKAIDETVRTGRHFSIDYRFNRPDGRAVALHAQAELLPDEAGDMVVLSGTAQDVTELRKVEQDLRESEQRLKEAQRTAHVGDWEWDTLTNMVYWSDELFRIYGYEPHEIQPDYGLVVEAMHPDSKAEFLAAIDAALRQDRPFELDYTFFRRDGVAAVLHTIGKVFRDAEGRPVRMAGIVQDITERKLAEDKIRESEDRFRSIFSKTRDGIMIADTETKRFIEANQAICGMLGYTHDEILGLAVQDIHPASELQRVIGIFESQISGDMPFAEDVPLKRKDGSVFYADINASAISLGGKRCLIGVFRDITERKKAEDKIRRSEAFIRNILDTVDEGFIVIDRGFRILTANKAYCTQVGESCDSVIGRHCYEISHKALRPCYEEGEECAVRRVFETGEPHAALHKHPDAKGSILYVETKAFPIKDSSGAVTSVIETVNNITEKHLLEEEQLKTQKLEAIGTLAGGIAHDFNNLLQGVFGYISMAKMTLEQKERSLAMLEQAEKALHMSVDLTTQLLTFSKGGKPLKKKILLQAVIENSAKFALSGSSVDYRIRFDRDLWAVEADEGQIGQVIQNIVLNADQAMPAGGTIVISARNVRAPGKGLPVQLAEGNYVEISVRDNGIGIPEQYVPRLFDPYFTTKEKGSGLGLATSYSIIRNHGGLIDVKSRLGKGSDFLVYLPALETLEKRPQAIPAETGSVRTGRVLVMDDEELVRNIVGIMLKALGHEVEFAEDGEEVVAKYREALSADKRFDIVILDLTVRGGMGGEEALRELLDLDPEVKAVVSSGYADSAAVSEYRSHGFSACLTKPYEVDALRDVLNMLLK